MESIPMCDGIQLIMHKSCDGIQAKTLTHFTQS